jgi:hypothetical protein
VFAIAPTTTASVSATLLAAAVTSTVSTSTTGRTFLELGIGLLNRVEEGDAHFLGALNFEGIRATKKCQFALHKTGIPLPNTYATCRYICSSLSI